MEKIKNQFTDLMMAMLTDKKALLNSVLKNISNLGFEMDGLQTYIDRNTDPNKDLTLAEFKNQLRVCEKIIKHQADVLREILVVLVVIIQGRNFDTDVAEVLAKMGHAQEALQAIFKQKMQGK